MQTIPPSRTAIATVLSHGSFRFLWFGQMFSQLAVNMMLFTLALLVYQRTSSNAAVSALFLSYGIPSVLFGLLAGVVVDHFDKRLVLIVCDMSRAVLVIGLFFALHSPFIVYGLLFIHALITQFYVPAEAPSIPRLVPEGEIVTANSLFSFTYYTSVSLGFISAGPMLRFFGPTTTFGAISLFFLLASFFVSRLPKQPGNRSLEFILHKDVGHILSRVLQDLQEGIRYVTGSSVLFDALFLLTGTQIMMSILGALGPGFADRVLEIDIRDASLVITAPVVIGIVAGALWVGNIGYRYKSSLLIKIGILGAGVTLMLTSAFISLTHVLGATWFWHSWLEIAVVIVLFLFLGVANSFLDVPANSILQKEAEGSMRSRIYGMLTAAVGGVGILPVVAGGVLADVIGVGRVIFAMGVLISCYGLYRVRYNTT